MRELIEEHPDLGIEELARRVDLSRSHLDMLFRLHLRVGLGAYRHRRRLELAVEMLRSSDLIVKQIAYRIGYKHPTSFIRAFTEAYGTSPLQYRRRHLGKEIDE